MEILEFVHRHKPLDIKSVGQQQFGLAAEQVFALKTGDAAYGGENMRSVRGGAFDLDLRFDIEAASVIVPSSQTAHGHRTMGQCWRYIGPAVLRGW